MNLSQPGYRVASDENRRITGRGLTRQTFNIARKIMEIDDALAPELQQRVREVHPELCFWALNGGRPMRQNKKTAAGRAERWAILRRLVPALPPLPGLPPEIRSRCGVDDYIDALVAAWTAACIVRGEAERVPDDPPVDERGLRMEMWHPRLPPGSGN